MKTATLKNGLELTLRKAQPKDATAILSYLNRIGGGKRQPDLRGENGLTCLRSRKPPLSSRSTPRKPP